MASSATRLITQQSNIKKAAESKTPFLIWQGATSEFLDHLPRKELFDLVVTSPPYNVGKSYETKKDLHLYLSEQSKIIFETACRLRKGGSICWQVGNFVDNGEILPLDIPLHDIFRSCGLNLRNRIVWRFGHGHHNKRRFSGRYEVVMWYTAGDDYTFDLDAVRVPAKYPGKRHYQGKKKGQFSSHPLGKNPEDVWDMDLDVWDIPNVKGNHVEKTSHPCQFPIGLAERLILALSAKNNRVFDPYMGVGSTGAAAALTGRRFVGCELVATYARIAQSRIKAALDGTLKHRPYDKPLYDHLKSKLSVPPNR
jgi:adenine-specific DNA-methyltransferase